MRIDDRSVYCYLNGDVLRQEITNDNVLDALLDVLQVPGKPNTLRALSPAEKLRMIEHQIAHFTRSETSLWFGIEPAEVLAASFWRSRLSNRYVMDELFCAVRSEAELVRPVAEWLKKEQKLEAVAEVPMGRCRADVAGYRAGGFLRGARVVAVELKNELGQLKRALDQMVTFRDYAHEVFLACTPALAAEYLDSHAESRGTMRWDPDVLDRKLEAVGLGLLLVEGDDVFEHVPARRGDVDPQKLKEVAVAVQNMPRL